MRYRIRQVLFLTLVVAWVLATQPWATTPTSPTGFFGPAFIASLGLTLLGCRFWMAAISGIPVTLIVLSKAVADLIQKMWAYHTYTGPWTEMDQYLYHESGLHPYMPSMGTLIGTDMANLPLLVIFTVMGLVASTCAAVIGLVIRIEASGVSAKPSR